MNMNTKERCRNIDVIKLVFAILVVIQTVHTFKLDNNTRIRRQACGFKCNSGECVNEDSECDGAVDCKDGSDETTACQRITCPTFTFKCKYGACIDAKLECDGKTNCRDNSDETARICKRNASSKCGPNQFQCDSGQCIHEDNKCDGTVQCDDQSDETRETCSGLMCPGFTYTCAYGACVNGNSQCNGVKECFDGSDEDPRICPNQKPIPVPPTTPSPPRPILPSGTGGRCKLPNYPDSGEWTVSGNVNGLRPGDLVNPDTILMIKCRNEFELVGASFSYCTSDGSWSNGHGVCLAKCPPYKNTTVTKVICTRDGRIIDCQKPTSGTVAKFWCIEHYEDLSLTQNPYRECNDRAWDHDPPSCKPVCGIKSVSAEPLIIDGTPVRKGDYPWQVALYQATGTTTKELICGGALINERMILTAAHCVTDPNSNEIVTKEKFAIAVGKYYRKFDDPRDNTVQFSTLKAIYVPPQYKGDEFYYQADIAILVSITRFNFSKWVQPVCVDRQGNLFDTLLNEKNKGFVTGWGFTKETSAPSEVLKSIEVPRVLTEACKQELPLDYESYLTYDKLCAGFVNQSRGVCRGDSGGGLVFKNRYDGRYYIQGVVSLSTPSDKMSTVAGCNSQTYALYTQVRQYLEFIREKERLKD